jgi:uncharacterized protein YjiS (DUF1127 family)
MSATPATIVWSAVSKRLGAWSRLLGAYGDAVAGYFVRRAAIASLHELDDRALRDIGLARSQIEAAVYGSITVSDQARR